MISFGRDTTQTFTKPRTLRTISRLLEVRKRSNDIGCLSVPTRTAVEIPMEAVAVPPLRLDLVPVAAIVLLPDHRVSGPPTPLQYARIAAQVVWNHVTELVCLRQATFRWQVEALWVQGVNRLAICSGVVRNAIRRGLCTHQRPPGAAVVDHHLNVTKMVGCDRMLERLPRESFGIQSE